MLAIMSFVLAMQNVKKPAKVMKSVITNAAWAHALISMVNAAQNVKKINPQAWFDSTMRTFMY